MKRTNIIALLLFIVATLVCSSGFAHDSGKIEIDNSWVREAPPHAAVLGAYMTIENHMAKTAKLVHISSPDFARVEMHRSVEKDGMMHMIKQSSIKVPANGKVMLKPGGYHLMLMKPKRALKAGDTVSLTLKFADGTQSVISVPVKKDTGGMDMNMKMDMDHHEGHDSGNMHHDMH